MRKTLYSVALASLLAAPTAHAGITFSDYNLITTGDMNNTSDVQGRVLVGGTLKSNAFTFGGHLPSGTLNPPAGIFNALANNVSNLNPNGRNFIFGQGNTVNGVSADPSATAAYTAGLANDLAALSQAYAGLATNSTVNATDRNQISFNAAPKMINGSSVAVFSIDQSFFTDGGTVKDLNGVSAGTTVVVNVTGGTPGNAPLNFSSGLNFNAFWGKQNEAKVIFNFINTTALNGIPNLGGSILAPNAVLNTNNTLVGSVYVKSITKVGEIDMARVGGVEVTGFNGFTPNVSAVPEPSSLAMCGLAGLAGLAAGWKRARKASA